jgi:hypothetical protein
MKRYLVLVGIILVVAGVLFEEKHRAATIKNHIVVPELKYPQFAVQPVARENSFADNIDLWNYPRVKTHDTDMAYANFAFQKDNAPASFEKFHSKFDDETEPVFTVQNREAAYAIFNGDGFKLTLNLKPAYPTPQALLPTRLDPSVGGSFSF